MKNQIRMENSHLEPLCQETANAIALWEYDPPYDAYNFKGTPNDYLFDTATWGDEQFCLMCDGEILGQVACQYEEADLWVGWSMAPWLCGQGYGAAFVDRCVTKLCRAKDHHGRVLLRVSARNHRAVRAYEKAGFRYLETIQDEIAYTGVIEDFLVMWRFPHTEHS